MSSLRQIEANRRNAQNSTGPRSAEGKAVSRMNALKSGIDAQSAVIPGEQPADLEALTAEYHQRFFPTLPEERLLVDTLVTSEWQLRRLRKVEAELWQYEMQDSGIYARQKFPLGHAFASSASAFNRLQRRLDSTHRTYLRALDQLQRLQSDRPPDPHPPGPAEAVAAARPSAPPPPQIGFVPHTPADPLPGPAPAARRATPPPLLPGICVVPR